MLHSVLSQKPRKYFKDAIWSTFSIKTTFLLHYEAFMFYDYTHIILSGATIIINKFKHLIDALD